MGHDEEDALYELVPSGFVAARTALEKKLRSTRDRTNADRVKALPRPTASAWGLNQVARTKPPLIEAVLESGAGLRAAMHAAVDGDASGLRAAQASQRAASKATRAAVEAVFAARGQSYSDAVDRRVEATLRAAGVDADVADSLRSGRLSGDHQPTGFGVDPSDLAGVPSDLAGAPSDLAGAPSPGPTASGVAEVADPHVAAQAAAEARSALDRRLAQAREQAVAAERQRSSAARAAEESQRALRNAEQVAAAAAAEVADAEQARARLER